MTRLIVLDAAPMTGCGASTPTPQLAPETTESLEDRIASYVQTWGGTESQYRVILTLDECENLGRLGIAQQETLDRLDE